jgi:diguanylate cyclase (GGDEF)-like protein
MNFLSNAFPTNTLTSTPAPTSVSLWSVRTFLICLVLACLLPGVIGATLLFHYQYQEGRSQLGKNTRQTARALVQTVDSHLHKAQAVAQALSTADSLTRHDFARFHQRAREAVALAELGTNVVLRDEAGRQLLNTAVDFGRPINFQAAPEQVRNVFATGKPTVSDVFIGPVLKRPLISVDVPVIINGKVPYALGVGILPEQFNALLKAQGLPSDWVAAVFDRTGTIVGRTHSPERFVGHKGSPELLQSMRQSPEGSLETTTVEGIFVLSSYSLSPTTHWGVAIGIPRQSLEGALVRTLSLLVGGVAALFGIGLVLAWFMGGRIARSVKALTIPAIALGSGASAPVPQVHIKEAAEVAQAIGRAADLLKERAAELTQAHILARFGNWSWNLVTGEVKTSDSLRDIYGREVPPFPEQRGTLLTIESWERVNAASQQVVLTGKGYDLELEVNHSSGETIWINSKCDAVRNEKGEVVALRGAAQDITERKRAEQRIRDAALHDMLTGLPNRAFVYEFCTHLLAAAHRNHSRGALLFIDLDRFKPVNDLYGHAIGDCVLNEVGKRLVKCTRHEDLVGRIGGDEYVIVLPYLDADRHRAIVVAQHVIDSISQPFRVDTVELSISPSIGISYFPEHATDAGALIHAADLAMYQAKQSGRANYQLYTPELDQRAEQALLLEVRLKNALKHGGLRLHYQPVIDIQSGKLIGAEALVRLDDSNGKAVGPDRFIPIAEAAGLIGELGDWVAAEACRQHALWLSQGMQLTIAINVSPLQFRQPTYAEKLSSILSDTGMDPACLEIEVTESAVMENIDEAVKILNRIKSLGVKVALDDFGTGYSSLSSLTSLPLDKLKIDQSFVRRIERHQASRAVVEAIIALGRSLRLDVHGEGIESEKTLRYLRKHGCNQAQGYWFSRPLSAPEFSLLYRDNGGQSPILAAGSV